MTAVMIGVDPHKGSHTAVAIGRAGQSLGKLRVDASAGQAGELVAWAAEWPERTWAAEGAAGLGKLLAQQLVAAGERVLDVPPKLASRVRLPEAGDTNKNDPNDARSVAVAALRSRAVRDVAAGDQKTVLKIWARRHRDLARARHQVTCRLHAVIADLVPGGVRKEISAGHAARVLDQIAPAGPIETARRDLAAQFLEDPRRLDTQLAQTKKQLAAAVRASGTTVTEVFGIGPVSAGTVLGDVIDVTRFPNRDHFAAYNGTAPAEVSSGNRKIYRLSLRGNRRMNHAIHMAAITQIRHAHSDGRACYDKKIAEGKTHEDALRCLKRKISDAIYARLRADARETATAISAGPGGQTGNGSDSSAAGSHPERRLFGQATPGPSATLRPPARPARQQPRIRHPKNLEKISQRHLTTKRLRSGAFRSGSRPLRSEHING
jgi:transposase